MILDGKMYLLCVPMEHTPKICLKAQSQPCSVIPVLFLHCSTWTLALPLHPLQSCAHSSGTSVMHSLRTVRTCKPSKVCTESLTLGSGLMVQSVKDVATHITAKVVEAIVNSVLSLYKYVCMMRDRHYAPCSDMRLCACLQAHVPVTLPCPEKYVTSRVYHEHLRKNPKDGFRLAVPCRTPCRGGDGGLQL